VGVEHSFLCAIDAILVSIFIPQATYTLLTSFIFKYSFIPITCFNIDTAVLNNKGKRYQGSTTAATTKHKNPHLAHRQGTNETISDIKGP
jgi:hypothetical protein